MTRGQGRVTLAVLLSVSLFAAAGTAAGQEGDRFTFTAFARPRGPATTSELRLHQPLRLLELCQQVKAGTLDRQQVERLVGGRGILDALLAMDLDALYLKLTGPAPAGAPRSQSSPWHQILTNGETAPPPPPDPLPPLDFGDLATGDTHVRALRVTALADGMVEARIPPDSPLQVLSMAAEDGVVLELPVRNGQLQRPFGRVRDVRAPEVARQQPPWQLPVHAGQDVDVVVGLPVGAAVPPGGNISSTITVGDPVQGLWRQDVPILAQPALKGDIRVTVATPEPVLDLVEDTGYNQNSPPYTFVVPLLVSYPNPAVTVQGMVTPLSLPPGLSMPSFPFSLGPNETRDLSFVMSLDRSSTTFLDSDVLRQFSVRVTYHTVVAPLASRTETLNLAFALYPDSQDWYVTTKVQGVNCAEDLLVYATGDKVRSGWCNNQNLYSAQVIADGTFPQKKAFASVVYNMGWLDGPVFNDGPNYNDPYYKQSYFFIREQPLIITWTKQ
jgi:hypothetical protein